MTTYRIRVTEAADREALDVFRYIAADSPINAARWYEGLLRVIESLSIFPERCPRAPESDAFDEPLRQKRYGRYRILFIIRRRIVFVLHVRHGARRFMEPEEIMLPEN